MNHDDDRNEDQAARDQHQGEPLELAEVTRARGAHDHHRRKRNAELLRQAKIRQAKRNADELGDDGQRIEQKQIDDAKSAPEASEPLQDQAGMPDPGYRAETQHHLLVDVENRNQ